MSKNLKRCPRCRQWKDMSEFNLYRNSGVNGRQSYCRRCQHEYNMQNRSESDRSVIRDAERQARQEDYSLLYSGYKNYRRLLEQYVSAYGDEGLAERMSNEYLLGI